MPRPMQGRPTQITAGDTQPRKAIYAPLSMRRKITVHSLTSMRTMVTVLPHLQITTTLGNTIHWHPMTMTSLADLKQLLQTNPGTRPRLSRSQMPFQALQAQRGPGPTLQAAAFARRREGHIPLRLQQVSPKGWPAFPPQGPFPRSPQGVPQRRLGQKGKACLAQLGR